MRGVAPLGSGPWATPISTTATSASATGRARRGTRPERDSPPNPVAASGTAKSASHMPPRAACTVSSARPASATISHSFGRERSAPASSGTAASTNATSSQSPRLSGAHRPMAWRAASLCSTPSTYSGVFQSAGLANRASAEATATATLSSGRLRPRSNTRYAPATAAPVSTAPCRLPHRASSGTSSQMRRDGACASERRSSAQAANSGSEKSWPRIATSGPKQAGTSSSNAIAIARSRAPERRASRTSSASVPATAATWATCTPRLPNDESSAKISSPSTGTFGQPSVTAVA